MPDETAPDVPAETFLLAPNAVTAGGKTLPGLQEAMIAAQILKLIKPLPPKTPGVAELKKAAIVLAQAGGTKLSKAK